MNQDQYISWVWHEYKDFHNLHCRDFLIEHYLPIVKYIVERISRKLPGKVDLDDLILAGFFGLKDAIEAYDPDRGVKFESFCVLRIRNSILDELRSMDWDPHLVRGRAHQLECACKALQARLGRVPPNKKKEHIKQFISKKLTRCEKLITILYYYEDMTMKEIGAQLDLPESRVSQIHASVVARMKAHLRS